MALATLNQFTNLVMQPLDDGDLLFLLQDVFLNPSAFGITRKISQAIERTHQLFRIQPGHPGTDQPLYQPLGARSSKG
jgi:hypothetical protein